MNKAIHIDYDNSALAALPNSLINRTRWDGVLSRDEVSWCRDNSVALAYDTAQLGWVMLDSDEGSADHVSGASRASADVTLRAWRAGDADVLALHLSEDCLWTYLPDTYPGPLDADAARNLIRICNDSDHHSVRAIIHDGDAVGQVRLLFKTDEIGGTEAEISYWIATDHQGLGLASQAVAQMTRRAFERESSLARIYAKIHVDNPASVKVVHKAGYRHLGPDPADPLFVILDKRRPAPGPIVI